MNYLVTEENSSHIFAVLKDADTKEIVIEKTALAVKEEFGYEAVAPIGDMTKSGDGNVHTLKQDFSCITEDGEVEVREICLETVTVY